MQTKDLSIAIIAKNEERLIPGCLESIAGMANEVVILLDNRSCDRTDVIAQAYGATLHRTSWRGFSVERNRALHLCQSEWVLFLDADERMTPELHNELLHLEHHADVSGYWIPRYNIFFNHIMRGGGWYPDHQLRLLRRTNAHYDEQQMVHEVATVQGSTATCHNHLLHINIEYLGEFWRKQSSYALSEARMLHAAGRKTRWRNFLGAPTREFWRRYILLHGWRDGVIGMFLCASLAWFEIVKYSFLHTMHEKEIIASSKSG